MKTRILFESVLRDAIFVPVGSVNEMLVQRVEFFEGEAAHVVAPKRAGYWTLKFDNGAILPIWAGQGPESSLWWTGETYRVSESGKFFSARLIREPAEAAAAKAP